MDGRYVPVTEHYASRAKVGDGKSVKVAVPENTKIESQKLYYIDGFLGFAFQDVETGAGETAEAVLNIEAAEFETDQIKKTDDEFKVGTPIYWDNDNKRLTETATTVFAGVVTAEKDDNNVIWFILRPWVVSAEVAAVATTAQAAAETAKAGVEGYLNAVHGEPTFEVSGETTDEARVVTVTLKDAAGKDIEQAYMVRVWLSDAAGGGETANTPAGGMASPAADNLGEVLTSITTNEHVLMLTEVVAGKSKFNLEIKEAVANQKWFLNVEWQGAVYSSDEIELKGTAG